MQLPRQDIDSREGLEELSTLGVRDETHFRTHKEGDETHFPTHEDAAQKGQPASGTATLVN